MELVKEYVKPELLEMEEGDFAKAAGLCEDLSKELDVDGSDVVGVIKKALELTPNGVEINGDSFEKFEGDDVVWTYGYPEKNRIPLDEIEWVRIEGYGGINEEDYDGAAILYVYLPIKNGMVDKDSVSFDYYPDKYTDDFVDSVGYVDVKSHGVQNTNESYDPKGDDGRKRVMNALDEFTQVLWDDTKVKGKKEHDLRRSFFDETVHAISTAIQKYFKYTRI